MARIVCANARVECERGTGLHLIAWSHEDLGGQSVEIGRFDRDDLRGFRLDKDLLGFALQADVEAFTDPN